MKRFFALILALVIALSLFACGSKDDGEPANFEHTDTTTVAVGAVILARDDVAEADVYNFVADIFDNAANLTSSHAKYGELSLEYGASVTSVPYHPGAAKYFAEKGFTVAVKDGAGTGASRNLRFVTGGESGTYYAFGGVIANVLTSKIDNVEVTAQTSGGSIDNARKLKNKEAEIAFMQNDVLQYAVTGTESMKDDGAMENLCAIASLYPEAVQLVATKSSGIKTIADLKGKKVCVGDQGSGSEVNASQIIAAAGMSYSDFDVQYLSFSEASTAMQNGTVDAAFATSALPNSAITELANYTDIVVVPIDGEIADNLIAQYPFYAKTTIGTDVYGVEAAETVAMMAVLTTTTDLDEEVVYNITKTLFENQADLIAGNAHGKEVTLDTALQGVTVDFHPGAVKYYKEKGIM